MSRRQAYLPSETLIRLPLLGSHEQPSNVALALRDARFTLIPMNRVSRCVQLTCQTGQGKSLAIR